MNDTRPAESATQALLSYLRMETAELVGRIQAVREEWGPRLVILGHHYQRDEVIAMTDLRGDSYQLSESAAKSEDCRAIVFCGVHFMAETADILANRPELLEKRRGQRVDVILPELEAGCSMADLADVEQVETCWSQLARVIDVEQVVLIGRTTPPFRCEEVRVETVGDQVRILLPYATEPADGIRVCAVVVPRSEGGIDLVRERP